MGYIKDIRTLVGNRPIILNSAGVIIKNQKNEILLVNRFDTNNWGLPGGYMELGESFEETALREIEEELNIKIKDLHLLHIFSGKEFYHEYPNGDQVYSVIAVYTSNDYKGDILADNTEVKEAKFFGLKSVPNNLTVTTQKILQVIN